MNGDPYRAPQPADRRVINRSGQASQRAAEQPQPLKEESPTLTPRSSGSNRATNEDKKSSKKGLLWTLVILLLVAAIAAAGWFVWSNSKNGNDGIDSSKYQAVFLVNGQIYFGDLYDHNDEYFRLTTGYQAQPKTTNSGDTEEAAPNDSGVQLIRLGDEVYGPENELYISKKQILHYENLKSDSKVTQLIDQNEKK
jgi:Flagellar basal body-associated protein